jgi:hypothetical protein
VRAPDSVCQTSHLGLSFGEAPAFLIGAASLFRGDGLFHPSAHLPPPLVHLEPFEERFHVHGLAVALCLDAPGQLPAASIQCMSSVRD